MSKENTPHGYEVINSPESEEQLRVAEAATGFAKFIEDVVEIKGKAHEAGFIFESKAFIFDAAEPGDHGYLSHDDHRLAAVSFGYNRIHVTDIGEDGSQDKYYHKYDIALNYQEWMRAEFPEDLQYPHCSVRVDVDEEHGNIHITSDDVYNDVEGQQLHGEAAVEQLKQIMAIGEQVVASDSYSPLQVR